MSNLEHLQKLRKLFEEAPIRELDDLELVSCSDGGAEVRLPFKPDLTQGLGVVHGGMVGLVADTAGWFAAASVYPQGLVTTAEYKINLLTGARGDLLATGRVVRQGRNLITCQLEVMDAENKLVAVGIGTYACIRTQRDR
ncbi:MAG: PaaI family thioesterase [Anaerolineales bacterium]|nr:MAG: PaaI family thioesterase [Anaerolineales bacterium]